jgi:uncharacterized cupredoxin-like copper-binding protein
MNITRRTLQLGLAVLWLLDGALQCQPFMFTKAFGRTELAAAGTGQPGIVAHPVHWASHLVIAHPVLTNSVFAAVQLGLGLGLLRRRSVRWALIGSIGWAVSVWWLGEGLGGLTTGETLLTGAPGAALLYAAVALLALPDRDDKSAITPSRWAIPVWASLWAMAVGLQLAGGNNSGHTLAATLGDAGSDTGGWIGRIDAHLSHQHIGNPVVAAVIATFVVVAMWSLVPGRARRLSAVIGIGIGLASWLLLQGLGELTTGQATDPNTGPLILLLGLAVLGARHAPWSEGFTPPSEETTMNRRFPSRRIAATGAALAMTASFGAVGLTDALGATTPSVAASTASRTVRAVETEYHIKLSRTIVAPGRVAITAINKGSVQHGLVINGPGVHDKLIGIVSPGHSATKTVTLRKGRYDVFCPISDHKMLGMNTHLTVS